ncbi:MAG: formate dehydrogenase accessory sulfurtransferase FdhD [Acidimicrobiia bacterium]|nr:formate dehydrogenase accessory sulfurtransferase FdhD [Acidimicrobiia bacterium]
MSDARRVYRVRHGVGESVDDILVAEEPVEFRLGSTPIAVLMRTPGNDAELGLGFALTEAIVLRPSEVAEVRPVPETADDERWEIVLSEGVQVDPEQFRRNLYTTSSCGVCGKASIDAVRIAAPSPPDGPMLRPEVLLGLPDTMRLHQTQFTSTGGIHAAGLFTADGTLLELREDIGRHNAVDKVIGARAKTHWPLGQVILMVSGRVSFEMVQKAAVAGIPAVCGVSAASTLAADLGEELGITVIGFLRDDGFNLYAGSHRLS